MREGLLWIERVRRRLISVLNGVHRIGRFRLFARESTVEGWLFVLVRSFRGQGSLRTKLMNHWAIVRCAYACYELLDLIFSQVDGQYARRPTSQSFVALE